MRKDLPKSSPDELPDNNIEDSDSEIETEESSSEDLEHELQLLESILDIEGQEEFQKWQKSEEDICVIFNKINPDTSFFHGSKHSQIAVSNGDLEKEKKDDWCGLYVTRNIERAKNYAVPTEDNYLNKESVNCYVHEVKINDESVRLASFYSKSDFFSNSEISGETKAKEAKLALTKAAEKNNENLNFIEGQPLLMKMGEHLMFYEGPETIDDSEVIIPWSLVNKVNFKPVMIRQHNTKNLTCEDLIIKEAELQPIVNTNQIADESEIDVEDDAEIDAENDISPTSSPQTPRSDKSFNKNHNHSRQI